MLVLYHRYDTYRSQVYINVHVLVSCKSQGLDCIMDAVH